MKIDQNKPETVLFNKTARDSYVFEFSIGFKFLILPNTLWSLNNILISDCLRVLGIKMFYSHSNNIRMVKLIWE